MPQGSPLVAPFDATIVAARLDPDPAHANQLDGSTNFILLRHEIPESYYQLFQGKRPDQVNTKSITPASKRTLYSLLMHLQPVPIDATLVAAFPWLSRVKLELAPGEPDPADEAALRAKRERDEDLAEAAHTLRGAVGAPHADGKPAENLPDDVQWVHQRLIRFEYLAGPPSSTCDDSLIDAIARLQNDHHPTFAKHDDGDGRVDTKGGTLDLLHGTREALLGARGPAAPAVDPVFLRRTTERDEHGLAKVVTGLCVAVRSGEALWRSGQAQGYAADDSLTTIDQIHWELFSEHLVVAGWEDPIEDGDADLQANLPARLMDSLEDASPTLDHDGLLTLDEVRALYRDGHGELLRRTPCRFVSHWGLDVEAAVERLETMGYDPADLRERLRPFMWWDQAADVLPPSRHVWHYSPIALLAEYAEHLVAMRPPSELDPATHSTLVARVLYDDGQPMPNVEVQLLRDLEVVRAAKTRDDGEATFAGVPVGDYGVCVVDTGTGPVAVQVQAHETTEVELVTEVPAPPRPRGSLRVTVRRHTGYRARDVEVWLEHAQAGPVKNDYTDHDGRVSFEDIPYGDYVITAGDAEPVAVTLGKKDKKVATIMLPPPVRSLHVRVEVEGKLAPHQQVEILDADVPRQLTNTLGVATFELREGRYRARVGAITKKVRVRGSDADANTFTVELTAKKAPAPRQGTLHAWVHERGVAVVAQPVMVFSPDGRWLDTENTDAEGFASFCLPAEPVIVASGPARASTTVLAQDFTSVILALAE